MLPLKNLACKGLTLLVLRPEYSRTTRSIQWLLMHWLLVSPSHEQLLHTLCEIRMTVSSLRVNVNKFHVLTTPNENKSYLNTLGPRQNGRHFADDIFKCIFLNENIWISIKSSLKFVPKGPINNIPALVQIMAWRLPGDKPLSEPMMVNLPTHICISRPQWVNKITTCDDSVLRNDRNLTK